MDKSRILVIDDEKSILEVLAMIFEVESDFEVRVSSDPVKWRQLLEEFRPDIVLVDYRMPAMNGDQLIRAINASEWRSKIRVIGMFSATPFSLADVQELGADAFFSKPFDADYLVRTLRSLLITKLSHAG